MSPTSRQGDTDDWNLDFHGLWEGGWEANPMRCRGAVVADGNPISPVEVTGNLSHHIPTGF